MHFVNVLLYDGNVRKLKVDLDVKTEVLNDEK